MKILLTGASGFLGKNLFDALIKDHSVRVILEPDTSDKYFLEHGAEVVFGRIESIAEEVFKEIDAVYHLAAIRYEWGYSWKDYKRVNMLGTQRVLELADKNKVERFIFVSTVFVFGYPPKIQADESSSYAPLSKYALSKMITEKNIKKFNSEMKIITVNPTMAYGPGDLRGMFFKLCKLIDDGKFICIGNGNNFIHLVHIDDLVEGLKLFLTVNETTNFILTSDKPTRLKDLAEAVSRELGKKIRKFWIPIWAAKTVGFFFETAYIIGMNLKIKFFLGEPLITRNKVDILAKSQYFSNAKIKAIGFSAKIGYNQGIKDTINWYKQNGYLKNN